MGPLAHLPADGCPDPAWGKGRRNPVKGTWNALKGRRFGQASKRGRDLAHAPERRELPYWAQMAAAEQAGGRLWALAGHTGL